MTTKLDKADVLKAAKLLEKTASAMYVTVGIDGPICSLTFIGDDGKLVTVKLFDVKTQARASVTRSEDL